MSSVFRICLAITVFTIFIFHQGRAQSKTDQFINVSVGLGISAPNDEVDVTGIGFYAQGEYIYDLLSWFDLRPYAGFVLTYPDKNDDQQDQHEYKATTKAFLVGGKARLTAPIPWVVPPI